MPLKPFAANHGAEKKIYLLKPRGFCAGVVRAIDVVEIALNLYGPPIYVRKEIVHNKHVVDGLRDAGAVFVEELDEVPSGVGEIDGLGRRTEQLLRCRRGLIPEGVAYPFLPGPGL